jgi:hypothetical protein
VARLFWQGHLTDLVAWGLGIVAVVLLLVDTFDGKASAHLGVWGIAVGLVVLGLWLAPARRQATRRNEAEAVREAEREVDQILERLVDRAERSVDELDRDRPDRSGGRSAR